MINALELLIEEAKRNGRDTVQLTLEEAEILLRELHKLQSPNRGLLRNTNLCDPHGRTA